MSILSGPGSFWHRGDHVTAHDEPYVVLNVDITRREAHLAPGDDPNHPGNFGRITSISVDELTRRA